MTRLKLRSLYLLCGLSVAFNVYPVEPIDPRSPQELQIAKESENQSIKRWLPARIKQLKAQQQHLNAVIDTLPQHVLKPMTAEFGYHSLQYVPDTIENTDFHSLRADFVHNFPLDSIGLVPAFDPLEPLGKPYAFPKRFKIEVLEGFGSMVDGKWEVVDDTEWQVVVDWLDQDFPEPGPYPVVFTDINKSASKVRLLVPVDSTDSDSTFFSLGELYLFRKEKGQIADNISVFGPTGVSFEASDSLSVLPVWDLEFVYDGLSGLGLPLSEKTVDVEDLLVRFDNSDLPQPVSIILDLGKIERIGRIDVWPTEAPQGMAIPLFGFPEQVTVELSQQANFSEVRTIQVLDARSRMHNDNYLTIICDGHNARFIRLTFDNLFEFLGSPILGIGEIAVQEFGKIFSVNCDISSKGIPDEYAGGIPRLVDGFSRKRRILPETDRIIGLAKRKALDKKLKNIQMELTDAEAEWDRLQLRLGALAGLILAVSFISAWRFQKRQRQRELNKLKEQITRDLHDEVGSSLGSISLASEQLESLSRDSAVKEELSELSLMAREANASLLEVVWMTDQKAILLPNLVDKLVERARKVLRNVSVDADVSSEFPELRVNLTAKRHLIMFFKEAIHNCARHADATRVQISAAIKENHLQLLIKDDGCGFDPLQPNDGWGLNSMKKRVEELRGDLDIASKPGDGTSIRLLIPLSNLLENPLQSYKTSN